MATETHIQELQPTVAANLVKVGDLWLQPSLRRLAACVQAVPTVVFMEIVRGAVPTLAVAAVATANADATYAQSTEGDLINELKTQVNALLVALRQKGLIS